MPPVSPAQAAEHRYRAHRILHDTRISQRGRWQSLWNYVLETELSAGTQFLCTAPNGIPYVVLGITDDIIRLPGPGKGGERWFSYFFTLYGCSERENVTKFVYDSLRAYIHEHGIKCELRRFSAYDARTQTAYLSAYNGRMYRIDGDDVTDVACGEDGIFFLNDDHGKATTPDVGHHGALLERLVHGVNFQAQSLGGMSPEQQRMAFYVWVFALAFPDLMPTKPILMVEGVHGAGKTATVTLMQRILMGVENAMMLQRNKEDDFAVILLRSPIAIFDNSDSYIDWVPDAVANYATGGVVTKRRLYSDEESITIKPHAFLAISSKNPASFRRPDVAERCVILRLERRSQFQPLRQLRAEIDADRGRLLGEYIWYVGQIVNELRRSSEASNETHRMADFAALGRSVGRVLGWTDQAVADLMLALQRERDAFVNEDDPLVELLQKWLAYRPRSGPSNIGRTMTAFALLAELETLAQAYALPWKETPRSLGQKLRSPNIEAEFRIEHLTIDKQKAFKIWRHSDARLEVVDDEAQELG